MIIKKEAKKEKSFRIPNYVIGSGIAGGALGGLLANPSRSHVNLLHVAPEAVSTITEGSILGDMMKGISEGQAPTINESVTSGIMTGAGLGALGSIGASLIIEAIKSGKGKSKKEIKEVARVVDKPSRREFERKHDNRDSALAVIPTASTSVMG